MGDRSVSLFYAMKEWAEGFYKSKMWQDCREAKFKQAQGLCERCRAKGIIKAGEIVHHKIHLDQENIRRPEVSLSLDNLELLCRDCHAQEHSRVKRRYKFDSLGRLIVPPE